MSDEKSMQHSSDASPDAHYPEQVPGLQLRAFSVDDPQHMLQSLSLILVTSGGC
jgi:hypothetical protein